MRKGSIQKKDIEVINKQVIKENKKKNLPEYLKYAVRYNKTRDTIHTNKFEMLVEDGEVDNNCVVKIV